MKKNAEGKKKFRVTLKVKIIGLGVSAIALAILVVAVLSYFIASGSLERQAFNQMETVNNIKKFQIESFFNERKGDIEVLANLPVTRQAIREIGNVFMALGGVMGGNYKGMGNEKYAAPEKYRAVHDRYLPIFKYYKEKYGYYDVFLMNPDSGEIFFTVMKEPDFGADVTKIDSSLKEVWEKAVKGEVAISDTEPYKPSNDAPAQFIAGPVKDGGRIIGVLAFQIPLDPINRIMMQREGMGKTGESYLVGKDYLMRSDSYLDKENHTVAASFKNPGKGKVETEATKRVFHGRDETDIILDYNGNPVLSAYHPVKVGDVTWAMMSEIDLEEVNAPVVALRNWIIGITLAIVAIASFLFFSVVNRNIIKPIMMLREITGHIAKGDLTQTVKYVANDEIGDLAADFNQFLTNVNDMVSNIMLASQNLAEAVNQISSGNQNLSQRTSEQASSLEEIASTVEQATATINQNAENASKAKGLTDGGAMKSKEGNRVAIEAVDSINEMNESSKRVAEIISVINDIAFQTNLLALNAAVEAARAGEQGRGFAVVAGEVRNLAQRSGNAAKEIADLIEETVSKVEKGTELVNRTGEALNEIAAAAETSAQIISEIAMASEEQKQGIGQINNAITEMDTMTQHNASLVEETASASEEMANQAQDLLSMVRKFKINEFVGGNGKGGKIAGQISTGDGSEHVGAISIDDRKVRRNETADSKKSEDKKKIRPAGIEKGMEDILIQEGFEEF